ncbi:MAG: hypothetical protein PHO02_06670 [Candidatus Nanoarchaeia archaeon]|nr:hypothetical protein [Candidatus Nanoarchaeia archaeon]
MKFKTRKKKGQIMAQPFVYIFALILGALILVWGIKMVYDFLSVANKAEIGQLKDKIDTEVKTYMNYAEGATKPIKLSLPGNIKYLCVSNLESDAVKCKIKKGTSALVNCPSIDNIDATLSGVVKSKQKNLLFTPFEKAQLMNGKFKIENLKPEGEANPLCYANGATLMLTTMADYVQAS